jgi:GR25 family glycosyltransferase involved in LPS biosynthesis
MIFTIIINLKKRNDRKQLMINNIQHTSLKPIFFEAVDGNTQLSNHQYNIMPNFINPETQDTTNINEIGCSLSHYNVWKYIVDNNIQKTLILEDDCFFKYDFNTQLEEIVNSNINYDLFFLFRNKVSKIPETIIEENKQNQIYKIRYSYNASSYIITYNCALKLLNSNFINNIIPVDEYLPIMYDDKYPFIKYSNHFKDSGTINAYGLLNNITYIAPRDVVKSDVFYAQNTVSKSRFNENLIYTYNNAISPLLCKTIISMYEKEDSILNVVSGDTNNFIISNNDLKWKKIYSFLNKELLQNVKIYLKNLNIIKNFNIFSTEYIGNSFLQYDSSFIIQKCLKNEGENEYYHDLNSGFDKSRSCIITFIYYLNDIEVGGETEICGHTIINPTAGKLLLFPTSWTFPYCRKMPISSDKYIITGWVYATPIETKTS